MTTYTIVRITLDKSPEESLEIIKRMLEYEKLFVRSHNMEWTIGTPNTYDISKDKPFGMPKGQ